MIKSSSTNTVLECRCINKTYNIGESDQQVLKNVSLQIEAGEMLAIMGASGSGKSTLLHIIGLLDHADSGEVILQSQTIASMTDDTLAELRNQTIGFVFQQFYLLPRLSVLQNVILPLSYRSLSENEMEDRAIDLLKKVGMINFIHKKPTQLSGGQQQRVALARALVTEPKILLADEPTGALDSATSHDIMRLLHSIRKMMQTTLIIVTHDKNIAEQCDRIIHLHDGVVQEEIA